MRQSGKLLLALTYCLGISLTLHSQDASKLYNTDLFTGVANVQIPITAYKLKNNDLGVSLSYSTKGVPVREFAGIAGLHWNLNVGGGISRMVKGLPDEWYSVGSSLDPADIVDPSMMIRYNYYKGRLAVSKENSAQRADQMIYRDKESDEYCFSVGNVQFSFYIGLDGGIYVSSRERYEVKFLIADQPYTVPSTPIWGYLPDINIQVDDKDNGVTYYFSPSGKEIRTIRPYFRSVYPWISTLNCSYDYIGIGGNEARVNNSWKLDKIVTLESEQVSYDYKIFIMPPGYSVDSSWTQIKDVSLSTIDTFSGTSRDPSFQIVDTFSLVCRVNYPYGKSIELEYDTVNTRLEFTGFNNNGLYKFFPKLNAVLYKEQGQVMKYSLDYDYFHTPSVTHPQEESNTYLGDEPDRYSLKLKGINIVDLSNNTTNPLYKFSYNNKKQRRFGKGLDYYGYYNGGMASLGQKGHSLPGIATRISDAPSMQFGILTDITTATGSKATFNYGIHNTLVEKSSSILPGGPNWQGTVGIGDGLRLESIDLSDINDPAFKNKVSYEYTGGQYFIPGGTFDIPSHFVNKTASDIQKYYRYEQMMNPSFMVRGANHGYSGVKQTVKNKQNEILSSSQYTFTNFQDGNDPARILILGGGNTHIGFPFTRKQYIRNWEMGLPLNVKNYDNTGLILSEELYKYNFITDITSSQVLKVEEANEVVTHVTHVAPEPGNVYSDVILPCNNVRNYSLSRDAYRPYKGIALLSEQTQLQYVSNTQFASVVTKYTYDARNNLKTTRVLNSMGENLENINIYNYDIPQVTGSDAALTKMNEEDIDRVVAIESWNNGVNTGTRNANSRLINASIFKYTIANNNLVNKIVYGSALEQPVNFAIYMAGQTAVSQNVLSAYTNPAGLPAYMEPLTNVNNFDTKSNPTETYVPQSNAYKSMIWDTISGKKIADASNAKSCEIAYAGFDKANEQNLYFNPQHRIVYNGNSMTVPSIGFIIPVNAPLVGNGVYVLEAIAGSTKELYITTLEANKLYRATFWASANAVPQFGIEGGSQFTLTAIAKKGEYKQYEVQFTPTAAAQKIGFHSNSGNIALEELRIHPANAIMENYHYAPLFGISVHTDALGRMIFFEYDGMGRQVLTRDQQGNILQKTEYATGVSPQ